MAATGEIYQQLEQSALDLPRLDRSKLASRLLESLDEDDQPLSPEWRSELQRRVERIDAGTAKMIPADEVWKDANQLFGTKI